MQKEQELRELHKLKQEEISKRELIEIEKEKLIREHEDLLRNFFSKGYVKSVSSISGFNNSNSIMSSYQHPQKMQNISTSSNPFK